MEHTSRKLLERAEKMEARIGAPDSHDHPRWLKARAQMLRRMAERRRKGLEHKKSQQKARSSN